MSALPDLIAQRDALNKQIEEASKAERAGDLPGNLVPLIS
jgi:hypothetical protein